MIERIIFKLARGCQRLKEVEGGGGASTCTCALYAWLATRGRGRRRRRNRRNGRTRGLVKVSVREVRWVANKTKLGVGTRGSGSEMYKKNGVGSAPKS